jgi:hypothetical protein
VGTERGVELSLDGPVRPRDYRLIDAGSSLVSTTDIHPLSVTTTGLEDDLIWIGGTTTEGDAIVVVRHGSAEEEVLGLGRGQVVDLEYVPWAAEDGTRLLAVATCDQAELPGCRSGLYSSEGAAFARISKEPLISIAASAAGRAVGVLSRDAPGLLVSTDAGSSWGRQDDPCGNRGRAVDAAATRDAMFILCALGQDEARLLRTDDGGGTWLEVPIPRLERPPTAIELAQDAGGWMWAVGSSEWAVSSSGGPWKVASRSTVPDGGLLDVDVATRAVSALVSAVGEVQLVRSAKAEDGGWEVLAEWPVRP